MLLSAILSYLSYSLATAFTPGPNNILALYSVSQKGWRRGQSILCGIGFGFLSVMILCALFCYELVTYLPSVTGILKYAGAAYIVFLAVHIALSRPDDAEYTKISFSKGFFLQFVNAKIILYAITVYTGYLSPHGQTLRSRLRNGRNSDLGRRGKYISKIPDKILPAVSYSDESDSFVVRVLSSARPLK